MKFRIQTDGEKFRVQKWHDDAVHPSGAKMSLGWMPAAEDYFNSFAGAEMWIQDKYGMDYELEHKWRTV